MEKDYVAFYEISRTVSTLPEPDRVRAISDAYEKTFRSRQRTDVVRFMSDRDLRALFKSASDISFYSTRQEDVHDMRLDLDELERRHIASDEERQSYYRSLYQSRQFGELSRFYSRHKNKLPKPVNFVDSNGLTGHHSVLTVDTAGYSVRRDVLRPRSGISVVVVGLPSCQYTQHAVNDISSDGDLRKLLAGSTSWLAPVDHTMDMKLFKKWNQTHPDEAMVIAYRVDDWPEIDDWATPTFYIYRDGLVVAKISGWPRQGRAEELKRAILDARNDK